MPPAKGGRPLEHHVLEEVREPCGAWNLIARADLVPGLHGRHGVPMVLEHQDTEPIVEGRFGDRRAFGLGQCERRDAKQAGHERAAKGHSGIMHRALWEQQQWRARSPRRERRCRVIVLLLILAAVAEVSGDFLMRIGIGGRRGGLVAGALLLAAYGLLVNQPSWNFGRTLGLYIVVFFVVSQFVAVLAGERPSPSIWLGGALIVAGGVVIHLGRP